MGALGSACAGNDPAGPEQSRFSLISGAVSGAEHDAVVMISSEHEEGEWSSCTGTLVTPLVMLTAKHCVWPVQGGKFVCSGGGDLVDNGTGAGVFGAAPPPETVQIFVGGSPPSQPVARGRRLHATEAAHACRDDLLAVVLDRPIDWVSPIPVRDVTPVQVGETVALLGYGPDPAADQDAPVRRIQEDVRILDVGAASQSEAPSSPSTPPRTFAVGGGFACYGDSGGPALDGAGKLVGVYSRISGPCHAEESRNTYMAIASFAALLELALADAGEVADLPSEGEGGAGGRKDSAGETSPSAPESTAREDGAADPPRSSDAFRCHISGGGGSRPGAGHWLGLIAVLLIARARRCTCAGEASPDVRAG